MKRLAVIFAALFFLAAQLAAAPLDPLFVGDGPWSVSRESFLPAFEKLGYVWTSAARDSARVAGAGITLFGVPAVESIARFNGEKLSEITVTFYARGDAGELPKEKFDALVTASAEAINQATKVKFTARGKDPTNAVKADGLIWDTPRTHYLLEFSFTREVKTRGIPFRAEFVRLQTTPALKPTGLLATAMSAAPAKFSGPQHVKRDPATGDVWITDVPMVDQGEKGYCVVASVERVMRYYGNQVDQQELAQVANTETKGGTSSEAMMDALKKLSARLKVRVRDIEPFEVREILKLMAEYNREAKRAGVAEIPEQGHMLDINAIYHAMNFDVLRDARTKNKSGLSRFLREVQMNIDQGIPLLFTVVLGLAPETRGAQGFGGHMRLIIGYNLAKEEILYSDSWGAGHELKRMPAADAWAISTGVMKVEPL